MITTIGVISVRSSNLQLHFDLYSKCIVKVNNSANNNKLTTLVHIYKYAYRYLFIKHCHFMKYFFLYPFLVCKERLFCDSHELFMATECLTVICNVFMVNDMFISFFFSLLVLLLLLLCCFFSSSFYLFILFINVIMTLILNIHQYKVKGFVSQKKRPTTQKIMQYYYYLGVCLSYRSSHVCIYV